MKIDTKKIRKNAFLTQVEFAELLGLSVNTIRKWEKGKNNPSLRHQKLVLDFVKKHDIPME